MKKLVVMVSVYQAGEFIQNRLDNLRQSSMWDDMEVWVVNADSPDPRDHDIPSQYPGVRYERLPARIGVYAAWNWIVRNTQSLYLTNANADDLIAPKAYEKMSLTLDLIANSGFTYPSWYATATPNLSWDQVRRGEGGIDREGQPGIYRGDLDRATVGHFPMWRRSLHDEFGLFDERFLALGDADWWARCFWKGGVDFRWNKEYLACYLFRNGQNLWHTAVNGSEWHLYHQKVGQYQAER